MTTKALDHVCGECGEVKPLKPEVYTNGYKSEWRLCAECEEDQDQRRYLKCERCARLSYQVGMVTRCLWCDGEPEEGNPRDEPSDDDRRDP